MTLRVVFLLFKMSCEGMLWLLAFLILSESGRSLSGSCDKLIIHGARHFDGRIVVKSDRDDHIYVIKRDRTKWDIDDVITVPDGMTFDGNVNIYGGTILASARTSQDQAILYVYRRNNVSWSRDATLFLSNEADSNILSTSISDDTAVVLVGHSSLPRLGQQYDLYVYRPIGGFWARENLTWPLAITPSSAAGYGGTFLVTGHHQSSQNSSDGFNFHDDNGAVAIFHVLDGLGNWRESARVTVGESPRFGCNCQVQSAVAVVLSCLDGDKSVDEAYIFSRSANKEWILETTFLVNEMHQFTGVSIEISEDESYISVGNSGSEFIIKKYKSSWSHESTILTENAQSDLVICDNIIIQSVSGSQGALDITTHNTSSVSKVEHHHFDVSFVYGMVILVMLGMGLALAIWILWPILCEFKQERMLRRIASCTA